MNINLVRLMRAFILTFAIFIIFLVAAMVEYSLIGASIEFQIAVILIIFGLWICVAYLIMD